MSNTIGPNNNVDAQRNKPSVPLGHGDAPAKSPQPQQVQPDQRSIGSLSAALQEISDNDGEEAEALSESGLKKTRSIRDEKGGISSEDDDDQKRAVKKRRIEPNKEDVLSQVQGKVEAERKERGVTGADSVEATQRTESIKPSVSEQHKKSMLHTSTMKPSEAATHLSTPTYKDLETTLEQRRWNPDPNCENVLTHAQMKRATQVA